MKTRPLATSALAILITMPAWAQSAVTIYGRVDMSISRQTRIFANGQVQQQSVTALDSGGSNGSRVGFRGQEDLGDGQKAVFVLEQGIQADTGLLGQGGRGFGRQAYVGLDSPRWGRLTAGRQYTPWFDMLSTSDPFGNNLVGNSGNIEFANARADNSVLYRSPVIAGISGQLMVAAGEGVTGRQTFLAGQYQGGPLWLGAAYGDYRFDTDAHYALLGASYDFGPVKLFGNIARLRNLNPVQQAAPVLVPGARASSWLLGASAKVGEVGVLVTSLVSLDDQRAVDRDARMASIGYNHSLSRRTSLYAAFARVINRHGGVLTANTPSYPGRGESQAQMGVSHVF